MDWYYPVLGGAVRGRAGHDAARRSRWHEFVVPGLGVRCVDTDPWVTGAETCELVLALDALGDRERARELFAEAQRLRQSDGGYWTGYVYPRRACTWPAEHTTYTTASVILAHDALAGATPGADLVRGAGLVADPEPMGLASAAARQPTPSPATPETSPQHPQRTDRLDVGERPGPQRALVDLERRATAVGGVGEHVVDREQPARHHPAAPTRRSRRAPARRRGRRR